MATRLGTDGINCITIQKTSSMKYRNYGKLLPYQKSETKGYRHNAKIKYNWNKLGVPLSIYERTTFQDIYRPVLFYGTENMLSTKPLIII
ncbi:unnamed protein product [Brachionus calyciflorus]|uniref:Uncharacterized protein n=1 Tax=Brachionus calyciflorus TaxID=104777 RepID=A0A813SN68_9BILA|nr:unnamed protein product [Brachionus calyciflorus]